MRVVAPNDGVRSLGFGAWCLVPALGPLTEWYEWRRLREPHVAGAGVGYIESAAAGRYDHARENDAGVP